jgi:hypothetical protein
VQVLSGVGCKTEVVSCEAGWSQYFMPQETEVDKKIRDRADDSWSSAVLREILLQCDDGVWKLPNTQVGVPRYGSAYRSGLRELRTKTLPRTVQI